MAPPQKTQTPHAFAVSSSHTTGNPKTWEVKLKQRKKKKQLHNPTITKHYSFNMNCSLKDALRKAIKGSYTSKMLFFFLILYLNTERYRTAPWPRVRLSSSKDIQYPSWSSLNYINLNYTLVMVLKLRNLNFHISKTSTVCTTITFLQDDKSTNKIVHKRKKLPLIIQCENSFL